MLDRLHAQAVAGAFRVTQHAQQEMTEEAVSLDEVLDVLIGGQVLEDYSEHRRGACCLLGGVTEQGRPLHVVCTTTQPLLIIITVYQPKPPRWATPTERGGPI